MSLQISELNKSLIFSAPLSEWYPDIDLISLTKSTNTDVYNVLDRQGSGRRELQYNGTSSYVTLPSVPAFGTGDFTVIANTKPLTQGTSGTLIGGASAAFSLLFGFNGNIYVSNDTAFFSVGTFTFDIATAIVYKRASGVGTLTINGVSQTPVTDITNYSTASTFLGKFRGSDPSWMSGSISMCRIFNYALTPTQITNYSKPEYPIEWADRGATGVNLVVNSDFSSDTWWVKETGMTIADGVCHFSSSPTVNELYKASIVSFNTTYRVTYTISGYSAGGIKSRTGQTYGTTRQANGTYSETITSNANATIGFQTVGTTTLDLDNVSWVQLGCVLDLNAEGLAQSTSGYWYDKTNTLTATNSDTTLVIPPASNLGAMFFNGTTSNVGFTGVPTSALGATDRTISCWVNPAIIGLQIIFMYGTFGSSAGVTISLNGSNKLNFDNTTTTASATSTSSISINIWTHILVTFGSGIVKYYLNGVLDGSATISNTNTSSSVVYIGVFSDGATYPFNGLLSNNTIWNRILSQDEITLVKDTGF